MFELVGKAKDFIGEKASGISNVINPTASSVVKDRMGSLTGNVRSMAERMAIAETDEPLRSYMWLVELPDLAAKLNTIPTSAYPADLAQMLRALKPNQDVVSYRVNSYTAPHATTDIDKSPIGNTFEFSGKTHSMGTLSLECLEMEDGETFRYFTAWQAMMRNANGTSNAPGVYKAVITLNRLNSTMDAVIRQVYFGCWPTAIGDQSGDYESSDIVKMTINFSVDSMVTQFIPIEPMAAPSRKGILDSIKDKIKGAIPTPDEVIRGISRVF